MLATAHTPPSAPPSDSFACLTRARYLSLTTFRRTGEPVATPVWFAERAGVLYVHTLGGKVKRIGHTPRVALAPCTIGGRVTGPIVTASARVVTNPAEAATAEAALAAKYGVSRRIYYAAQHALRVIRRRHSTSSAPAVYLAIEPAGT